MYWLYIARISNTFMKKTFLLILTLWACCAHAQTDTVIHGKISIDAARWYQLNNVANGLQQLFDGDLYTRPNTGWGKILSNYNAYYPVPAGMDIQIDSIKMFDWEGSITDYPVTFYIINDTSWQYKLLATFKGERYNGWDGPYPDRPDVYALDTPRAHVSYIVMNAWYEYPTEVEFYGSYKAVAGATPATKTYSPLKNFFGINAFEWDFENPANPMVIEETRMNAIKSFTAVRHYMDWQKLESAEGKYTYSPVHSGGWNYDTIYARCKTEGITVLADLKTLPDWMVDGYPAGEKDWENVPVEYGADFANPASYIKQGKVAFQYAARYGSNKNVKRSLLTIDSSQRWTNDEINVIKIGLNLVKYIECDNERDKWWKGRRAYQTGREYAANLSAFYDGHMKKLGVNVGVKNADPKMLVVMGGLASANPDYVRGMIDWCKEFRGYKTDGTVNLCWDVVNYHLYANDARYAPNNWPTTGVSPEASTNDSVAAAFIQMVHEYAADMPVWVTETGYDLNQGSQQKAIPIGNKSAQETQADWIVRTALLYARAGVQRLFFYNLVDDAPWSSGPYATSGLVNDNRTRRPAADYLLQLNRTFGAYTYQQTMQSSPMVDKYSAGAGKAMYAVWLPTQDGSTLTYSLDVENADTTIVYSFQPGSDKFSQKRVIPVNGHITLTVSETPQFVTTRYAVNNLSFTGAGTAGTANLQWQVLNDSTIRYYTVERSVDGTVFNAIGVTAANKKETSFNAYAFNDASPASGINYYRLRQMGNDSMAVYSETIALQFSNRLSLKTYPNPAAHYVTVEGLPGTTPVALTLINIDGKLLAGKTVTGATATFDIGKLPPGIYYVVIQTGQTKQTMKFVKGR